LVLPLLSTWTRCCAWTYNVNYCGNLLNAHTKAEFLVRLKVAGSENICIPTITVGTDPAIK
jgi:hypothetical protein